MHISVAGLGHISIVIGAALYDLGHKVGVIDSNKSVDKSGAVRSRNDLYMDGQRIFLFTLKTALKHQTNS